MLLRNWGRFLLYGVIPFGAYITIAGLINNYIGDFAFFLYLVCTWGILWIIQYRNKQKALNDIKLNTLDCHSAIVIASMLKNAYVIDHNASIVPKLICMLCNKLDEDEIKRRHNVE